MHQFPSTAADFPLHTAVCLSLYYPGSKVFHRMHRFPASATGGVISKKVILFSLEAQRLSFYLSIRQPSESGYGFTFDYPTLSQWTISRWTSTNKYRYWFPDLIPCLSISLLLTIDCWYTFQLYTGNISCLYAVSLPPWNCVNFRALLIGSLTLLIIVFFGRWARSV